MTTTKILTSEEINNVFDKISSPYLAFEISESGLDLDTIIKAVESRYKDFKFWGTKSEYESCIMAIFESRD